MTSAAGPWSSNHLSNLVNSLIRVSCVERVGEAERSILAAGCHQGPIAKRLAIPDRSGYRSRRDGWRKRAVPGEIVEPVTVVVHHRSEPLQPDGGKQFCRRGRFYLNPVFVQREPDIECVPGRA